MKRKILFLLFGFLFIFSKLFSQDLIQKSYVSSVGFGFNDAGWGILSSYGYQIATKNERVRFIPNLRMGNFSSFGIIDAGLHWQYLVIPGFDLQLDLFQIRDNNNLTKLIKFQNLSFFIGAGSGYVNAFGIVGPDPRIEVYEDKLKYYFEHNFTGQINAGFRFSNTSERLRFCIIPLCIYFGPNDYEMGFNSLSIEYRFKK